MQIREVQLAGFRNYDRLALATPSRRLVLLGPNGQGKTNLLEALYLGLTGDSFRGGHDRERVGWGKDGYRVRLEIDREDGKADVLVSSQLRGSRTQREVKVNGTLVPARELRAFFAAVVFTPDTLFLVKGGPSERRRFIDDLLCQASSYYRHHWQRYQRLLAQRNAILQRAAAAGPGEAGRVERRLLETFTDPFLEVAARVWERRLWAVRELAPTLARAYQQIAGGTDPLAVQYESEVTAGTGDRPESDEAGDGAGPEESSWPFLRERLLARLRQVAPIELRRGVTLVGPQRDDLRLSVGGVDLRTFGSQGQQRSAVLALKLAEVKFVRQQTGRWPVLLLDDVLSELDPGRRQRFLAVIPDPLQVWITTAEPEMVVDLCRGPSEGASEELVMTVAAGRIEMARTTRT